MRVVAQPSAHFGEGGGLDGAGDGLVTEGGVPPWGKTGDVGVEVACVGMKDVGLARTEDRASAEIGVDRRDPCHLWWDRGWRLWGRAVGRREWDLQR